MTWARAATGVLVLLWTAACSGTTTSPVTTTTPASTSTVPAPPATDLPPVEPASWPPVVQWGTSLGRFDAPVDIEHHPVTRVAYVVERIGVVQRVAADGTVVMPPALDLRSLVRSGGEQGLLGLAFHPTGRRAFVNFTDLAGDVVVAELNVNDDGTLDVNSRRDLLRLAQPYSNHNGGEVLWGPDDALWIPTGDGGSAGDPDRVALNPRTQLGKLLRIDVDTGLVETWASGLRNPWRASFDPLTGDLWLADVGQRAWEEITVAPAATAWGRGGSFGWSAFEGSHRFNQDQPVAGHIPPTFEYAHGDEGCSVTGGVRYRGQALRALWGAYVFADYCSGRVRALPVNENLTVGPPVDLVQMDRVVAVRADTQGEIWVVSIDGDIRPLVSGEHP